MVTLSSQLCLWDRAASVCPSVEWARLRACEARMAHTQLTGNLTDWHHATGIFRKRLSPWGPQGWPAALDPPAGSWFPCL